VQREREIGRMGLERSDKDASTLGGSGLFSRRAGVRVRSRLGMVLDSRRGPNAREYASGFRGVDINQRA